MCSVPDGCLCASQRMEERERERERERARSESEYGDAVVRCRSGCVGSLERGGHIKRAQGS